MSRRRAGATPQLTTIYWRDIPAQVNAATGRAKEKALLTARFQHAIDRAAVVAGMTETNAYVNEWRRVSAPLEVGDDPAEAAAGEAKRLEDRYTQDRLETLVRSGGEEQGGTSP